MTIDELREYDGVQREDKRVLLACDGNIFDVSKNSAMYGPGQLIYFFLNNSLYMYCEF